MQEVPQAQPNRLRRPHHKAVRERQPVQAMDRTTDQDKEAQAAQTWPVVRVKVAAGFRALTRKPVFSAIPNRRILPFRAGWLKKAPSFSRFTFWQMAGSMK